MLHQCMKSIDFAIKCFWNLHAIQFYSKVSTQWDRCDELRQNLEMIVVNGQLPRSLLSQIPPDIQQTLSKSQTYPIIDDGEEKKSQNNRSPQHRNGHSQQSSNGHHINSTLPQPKKPRNLLKSDPLLNGAHEYLKKQRRCTYFNAELDFAHFLEGVSSALGTYALKTK